MKKSKVLTMVLTTALLAGMIMPAGEETQAAKKPRLSSKSITLKVGQSKTLKVKKKVKKAKISWKSKNKKIAVVSKKGKVTAKKVGTTKVVCKVKKGKKKFTLTCKVTVKKTTTPKVVPTTPAVPTIPAVVPTQPAVPTGIPTPTPTPAVTYHPNWPSTYKDDYKPLKSLAKTFKVGSAIAGKAEEYAAIYDQDMSGILQKHYNSTTFTNLMKPVFLLDQEGCQKSSDGMPAVTFESCKKELQFCQDTGISLRAHVLVWYNQTPDWFFRENYDEDGKLVSKAVMKQRMESYIKQVVTYVQTNYPGVVYCWDVVNEAVEEDGSIRKNNNNWYDVYSEGNEEYAEYEYVKDAFIYAKKYVEPGVALVYNDYNTFKPEKRKGILDLVNYVNADEKLIDTVGMQCPILPNWPEVKGNDELDRDVDACMEYALEDFGKAGLDVMITELCVRTEGSNTKEEMIHQAERYHDLYQLFVDMDKENGGPVQITSVTTFGISDSYRLYDQDSWREGDQDRYAWLFDYNCKAKLAFKTVYNVFAKKAGVETVEETYEEPEKTDPKPDNKEYCRVEGVAKTKNGILLADTMVTLINETSGVYKDVQTDSEGKFSTTILSGTYDYIYACGIGEFNPVTITKNGDEATQIELITNRNYYWMFVKICLPDGTPIENELFELYYNESEESYNLFTDDNGILMRLCPEGKARLCIDTQANNEFINIDISKNIGTEENPEEIRLNENLYKVSILLDNKTLGLSRKAASVSFVESGGAAHTFIDQSNEDENVKQYYRYIPAGTYRVYATCYDFDSETDKSKRYFLGTVNISENSELDYTKVKVHKLEFNLDNEEDYQLKLRDWWIYPKYSDYYVVPMKDRLKGEYIVYERDEEGEKKKVSACYIVDQELEIEESAPETVEVELTPIPYEFPQIKTDKPVKTSTETIYNTPFGSYYKFVPETDGTYTISLDAGQYTEDMKSFAMDLDICNEAMDIIDEQSYYWDALGSQPGANDLRLSLKVGLEAGQTYYIWSDSRAENEADVPITLQITKA